MTVASEWLYSQTAAGVAKLYLCLVWCQSDLWSHGLHSQHQYICKCLNWRSTGGYLNTYNLISFRTQSSLITDAIISLAFLLKGSKKSAMLWSLSIISIIAMKNDLETSASRASYLLVIKFNAPFTILLTSDRFNGPFIPCCDTTCLTVKLSRSVYLRSNVFLSDRAISALQNSVFLHFLFNGHSIPSQHSRY